MTFVRFTPSQLGLALVLGCCALAPGRASAEAALVLPARANDVAVNVRDRAQSALTAALERQGVQVTSREQAVRKLPTEEGRDCVELDCAWTLVRAAGVDFAAAIVLSSSGGSQRTLSVVVSLLGARGTRFPGTAQVEGEDVERAVSAALADARGLQLLGPGPWLRVHGTPEGAEVHLDGAMVGSLPFRAAIEAGLHTLEVRAEGHAAMIRSLQVPPNAARQVDVQVALVPRNGAAVAGTTHATESTSDENAHTRRVRPVVGPVLLGSAGLGLLVMSVVLATVDACEVESEGRCLDGAETNTGAVVAWGVVGGAAIGGAILWHVLGGRDKPVETRVGVTPTGVSLQRRF